MSNRGKSFLSASFLILSIMMAHVSNISGSASSGTEGFEFLDIPLGIRSTAMAGGGTALVTGQEAALVNPAGLTTLKTPEIGLIYSIWIQEFSHSTVVAAMPLSFWSNPANKNGIHFYSAVSAFINNSGSIPVTIIDENLNVSATSSTFSASDTMLGLSLAADLSGMISLGVTGRALTRKISDVSVTLPCFDAGLRINNLERENFLPSLHCLNLAFGVRNIGTGVKMLENSNPLKLTLTAGLSAIPFKDSEHEWSTAIDTQIPAGSWDPLCLIGTEYVLKNLIMVRAGYRMGAESGNLTFGGGINLSIGKLGIRTDYTYVSYNMLGPTHRIGLTFSYLPSGEKTDYSAIEPVRKNKTVNPEQQKKKSVMETPQENRKDASKDQSDFEIKDEE